MTRNPLDITWEVGAPHLVNFAITADEQGQIIHSYTFDSGKETTWSHLASDLRTIGAPPAHSIYLGRTPSHSAQCWGTASGKLVLCRPELTTDRPDAPATATNASSERAGEVRPSPTRISRVHSVAERPSPVRNVVVAMLSLAGALAAVTLGTNSTDTVERIFDPGERVLLDPVALTVAVFAISIGMMQLTQDSRGGGRRASSATPAYPTKWVNLYEGDRARSKLELNLALSHWTRPGTAMFAIMTHMVICVIYSFARLLRLRVTVRGNRHGLMLPQSHLQPHWRTIRTFSLLLLTTSVHSAAFALEPATAVTCSSVAYACLSTTVRARHAPEPIERMPTQPTVNLTHTVSSPLDQPFRLDLGDGGDALVSDAAPIAVPDPGSLGPRGRALKSRIRTKPDTNRPDSTTYKPSLGWMNVRPVRRWVDLVIDSGCTWHVHPRLDEMVNVRDCRDVVEDAAGNQVVCSKKGDLPLIIRSSQGVELSFTMRDVRWAPSFPDSLVSVNQLWESSKVDYVFRDEQRVVFACNHTNRGEPLTSPFRKIDGLYRWTVGIAPTSQSRTRTSPPGRCRRLKAGIHAITPLAAPRIWPLCRRTCSHRCCTDASMWA